MLVGIDCWKFRSKQEGQSKHIRVFSAAQHWMPSDWKEICGRVYVYLCCRNTRFIRKDKKGNKSDKRHNPYRNCLVLYLLYVLYSRVISYPSVLTTFLTISSSSTCSKWIFWNIKKNTHTYLHNIFCFSAPPRFVFCQHMIFSNEK